jgi:hypothetical protein
MARCACSGSTRWIELCASGVTLNAVIIVVRAIAMNEHVAARLDIYIDFLSSDSRSPGAAEVECSKRGIGKSAGIRSLEQGSVSPDGRRAQPVRTFPGWFSPVAGFAG